MPKVKSKYLPPFPLFILLFTGTVSIYFPVLAIQTATTQATEQIQLKQNKQVNWQLSWSGILNLLRRKKTPLGSRGGSDLCAIAPGKLGNITEVWSDRPLFLWQGRAQKIAVLPQGSKADWWSQPVTAAAGSATYAGAALQPGRTYEWMVFAGQSSSPTLKTEFQVMDAQRRDRMTAELTALEMQLRSQAANDEAIALARANYFAQHQLWSDVLQQAFSVQNRSDALASIVKNIPAQLFVTVAQ